ncbi:MAG TPA: hypothetical protein VGD10_00660 [Allosphingosinicella sp.]|uniref:hypothetical protein n=1 Tax=Allosphingosinicella sp. TaxID=2823234 RepID=UPI002ED78111
MSRGKRRGSKAAPEQSRVRAGRNRRAQRVKAGGYYWSEEAEEIFFDQLAASCNVRASAEAVGFTTFTVYRHRRLRPDFAQKWALALEQGYARLEMAVLCAAVDSIDGIEFDADRPIPKMSVDQAMNVLRAHRNELRGDRGRGPGRRRLPPRYEDVAPSIERKVRAIKALRKPGDAAAHD